MNPINVAFLPNDQYFKKSKVRILLANICKQKYKTKPEKIKIVSIFSTNDFFNRIYLKIKTEPVNKINKLKKSTILTG